MDHEHSWYLHITTHGNYNIQRKSSIENAVHLFFMRLGYGVEIIYKFFTARQTLKRYFMRKLVLIDLEEYFKNFCMDSNYPDQIKYNTIYSWNYYSHQCSPLNIASRINRRDKIISFGQLDNVVRDRFIGLIPSITLTYFSRCSKSIYYQCLDKRGIEFCFFNYKYDNQSKNTIAISKNGRLMSSLKVFRSHENLLRFVNSLDTFRCPANRFDCPVNRTYRQLIVEFSHHRFNEDYCQTLQHLLHDGVKTVKIFIYHTETVFKERNYPTLKNFEKCLELCQNADNIGVCFHEFDYDTHRIRLKRPVQLANNVKFSQIKNMVEYWALARPAKQLFKLIYQGNGYLLHDGKLRLIEYVMQKNLYLVENRTIPIPPQISYSQQLFFAYLECPYPFEPFRYHEYFI